MIRVVAARLEPYALALRAPLPTPFGRTRHRRGWLLRLQSDAAIGFGDAAPWPGFGGGEARCDADLERLVTLLPGTAIDDLAGFLDDLGLGPEARHAGELALLDAIARARGVSLCRELHGRDESAAQSHRLAIDETPAPASCFKVKVTSLDETDRRLETLRARHPEALLRLDAGGRWSLEEAEAALARLGRHGIALCEQPVASLDDLARLRARCPIPLAVDEGLRGPDDLPAIAEAGAHAVVIKPMFLGGVARALELARRAEALGLGVVITNALESAIGRAGALHLAAGFVGHHGLGSALREDVATMADLHGDWIALPPGAGLGLEPRRLDLPSPLASAAEARADHPALITPEITFGYGELARATRRRAAAFAAQGIGAGDRVALGGPRDHEWVVSFHALGWLGAEVAPLPDRPGPERERIERAVDAAFVFDGPPPECHVPPPEERFWPLDEPRVVICSSGSTGAPKPIALTTAQLVFSAFGSATRLGLDPADRWLCCLPLHHVGGLSVLIRSAFYGTTAVLHPRFDVAAVSRAIDEGVTLISLVPEMLARLIDHRPRFPSHLRAILVGGAALDERLRARCRALALPIAVTWGMTEAASQLATAAPGDLALGLPPLPFARVTSDEGRLIARGPVCGGTLRTGDRGRIEAGRVFVTGRADEAIVSGGEKLDPRAIEAALARHPGVREAAVVGVPSARWGARPVAFVVGSSIDEEALEAHCRATLPAREIPDRFVRLAALPRTALGKIARGLLVDQAQAEKALGEPRRRRHGLEGVEAHHGVHVLDGGPHDAVVAAQSEGEGDRPRPEARHRDLDGERLAQAHGPPKIGLGMHEGQPDPLGDHPLDAPAGGGEQLLEGCMAELEDAAEEDDPRAIDLEEARRVAMNEGHHDDRR